jgi:3-methyladenine DNA glycosylase AlkD
LEGVATKATRDGMARYGLVAPKAYGVSMANMQRIARELGQDHALALDLWDTGWYEARTVAVLIADPDRLTAAQMERWCRDFDNWAIADSACFFLFDKSKHAWRKVEQWSQRKDEFVRRAAFALLASLALHDKESSDTVFRRRLGLIEELAHDDRNFVKKAVSWALHAIGTRSAQLNEETIELARKLSASSEPAERWVGKDALRKLTSAATQKRFAKKSPRGR